MVVAIQRCRGGDPPRRLRFATFNIEDFPQDRRQIDGAFDVIAGLDLDLLAVEEIMEPERFRAEARARLGARWEFVHTTGRGYPRHRTGVLFDGDRFSLRSIAVHDDTRRAGGPQPVLDVRLRRRDADQTIQVMVIHLRCCTEGRPSREAEHAALRRVIARHRHDGEPLIVLGDFNATEPGDRADLAATADAADLRWATEGLACSAFWQRAEDCPTSRLDHVLTSLPVGEVRAAGACADGCQARDRCPLYRDEVSDHCPVVVTTR
jgi:endonuclease/exonuclease/phosphatase family metal-dependent hydrolase